MSRSSIFARIFSIMSLFSTAFPADVFHPFLRQLRNHDVTQSMAYLLSVMMTISLFLGTISNALKMAVSSARWFVCLAPGKVSDTFLQLVQSASAFGRFPLRNHTSCRQVQSRRRRRQKLLPCRFLENCRLCVFVWVLCEFLL